MTEMDIDNEKNKNLCLETVMEMLKLRNSIEHTVSPVTQRYGLTPIQAAALYFIHSSGDATVGSVFRAFKLNQGNASSMCKRLESEGFILRRRSEEDERKVVLALTEHGHRVIGSIEKDARMIFPGPGSIGHEEKRQLIDSLNTIKNFAVRFRETIIKNNEERDTNA